MSLRNLKRQNGVYMVQDSGSDIDSDLDEDYTLQLVHSKNSKEGIRMVTKPNLALEYNKFMGGVDKFDQFSSTYPYDRKFMMWYKVLWHFCIEAALINS